jgi:simple sugar transport system ATP-binding protein
MTTEATTSTATPAEPSAGNGAPLIEARNITKFFGSVIALYGISITVRPGEVVCLLGDNGAGKSTLIKTLSGVHPPDDGEILVEGQPVQFTSPRDALQRGIATVYQDLAMIPLMSISRNFFLGSEPTTGFGPFEMYDGRTADRVTRDALRGMGIDLRDTSQPVGTLSGGERQSVAIARAIHFGAKVVILDEPTSALGVKEAGVVLRFIKQARDQGIGVILITHNVNHAFPVGDRFTILDRGRMKGTFNKADLTPAQLLEYMGGGAELEELRHELEQPGEPAAPLIEEAAGMPHDPNHALPPGG